MVMMEVPEDLGKFSDGYHTFDELYEHRCLLFITLQKVLLSHWIEQKEKYPKVYPWYSLVHNDGEVWDGWFIVGVSIDKGKYQIPEQITYHIPTKHLELVEKTGILCLAKAPAWDGHTSEDVLDRLTWLIQNY